jgi:hypothetical protein
MLAIPYEAEALARRLADKFGKTPEAVITELLTARAAIVGISISAEGHLDRDEMVNAANAIALRSASRPILDTRSDDDILGYNVHGITISE